MRSIIYEKSVGPFCKNASVGVLELFCLGLVGAFGDLVVVFVNFSERLELQIYFSYFGFLDELKERILNHILHLMS